MPSTEAALPVIVALDCVDAQTALAFVCRLDPSRCRVKVGKTLFTSVGPTILEQLGQRGFDVFLDLKYHDIPETVAKACQVAASKGVWMLDVHAQGGTTMLAAARQALDESPPACRPLLVAVTLLTSLDEEQLGEMGVSLTPQDYVLRLAQLAQRSGCDGVVCSAHEVQAIKNLCGSSFLCITPGIRMVQTHHHDQKRVMSPQLALSLGSDFLVMGRSVFGHEHPMHMLEEACQPPSKLS